VAIKYGKASRAKIEELHPLLARVLYDYADVAPPDLDITIVCGQRGEAEQNAAFAAGKSKKRWPDSAHNKSPARAVDICPFYDGKLQWGDRDRFLMVQGALRLVAAQRGIKLKPMISWDSPHIELQDP
jgi:hypothetical protein